MSQAIDLPFTETGLEMMFLTASSVQHQHLCGTAWGISLVFKGNKGINTGQVLPEITAPPANPFLIYQSEV